MIRIRSGSARQRPMRRLQAYRIRVRELKMVGRALLSQRHPILAHIIPMRRCNLSCSYCNEYDDFSPPIPTGVMQERIDHLARLGTSIVTISGGEPLMHRELEAVISRIRDRNMIAGLITNGYLLARKRIRSLNRAGLEHLQISIDNVKPDGNSMKSLKVLDKKLLYLSELAEFQVNINTVLGSGVNHPEDALIIARRAVELGFTCTVGVIHDGRGGLKPLSADEVRIFHQVKRMAKRGYSRLNRVFQENLAAGRPNKWRCRAGSRYLYVCEDGLVHYCSQQRGYPGIPLAEYTPADIRREHRTQKSCAAYCTVSCVHQASIVDEWRAPQGLEYLPGIGRVS